MGSTTTAVCHTPAVFNVRALSSCATCPQTKLAYFGFTAFLLSPSLPFGWGRSRLPSSLYTCSSLSQNSSPKLGYSVVAKRPNSLYHMLHCSNPFALPATLLYRVLARRTPFELFVVPTCPPSSPNAYSPNPTMARVIHQRPTPGTNITTRNSVATTTTAAQTW